MKKSDIKAGRSYSNGKGSIIVRYNDAKKVKRRDELLTCDYLSLTYKESQIV